MKTVIIPGDISVPSVVGDEMYRKYLSQLEFDIVMLIKKTGKLGNVCCPGCGGNNSVPLCEKIGLTYLECRDCGSYFISPRPSQDDLVRFYENSEACRAWRSEQAQLKDEELYYIYGPRVEWVTACADEYLGPDLLLLDVHTKYYFLIRHIIAQAVFKEIKLLDAQLFEKKDMLPADLYVSGNCDECKGRVDMMTMFEGLERMSRPLEFFITAGEYCRQGGLLLFTTATSSGFEYQVLRGRAPNLNPINRLNLLSLESMIAGLEQAGFEVLELSTPGRRDVDIVRQALKVEGEAISIDPFWRYVFSKRSDRTFKGLQEFLQENRLSSHVRMVAKKK